MRINSGGSSGIRDIAVKISLANTKLCFAAPFILVVYLKYSLSYHVDGFRPDCCCGGGIKH